MTIYTHVYCTPFPISWFKIKSVIPCPVLTVASWPAYRFLKRQVRQSGILIFFRIFQLVVIHTVKGFGIVNSAEIDVFPEHSCFFDDPVDVGYLISGSSGFSKPSLYIWKFSVHVMSKVAQRILGITLKNMKWVQLYSSFSILWHCLSLGLE